MENVVIIGTSGHSKVASEICRTRKYNILGYVDDFKTKQEVFNSKPILGKVEDIPDLYKKLNNFSLFIAIGENSIRSKILNKIESIYETPRFINLIHSTAIIADDVKLGKGILVAAGAVINSESIINDFVIINTKSSIDHDCIIGNFTSINPGVTTGGNVKIGEHSAIGIQSCIKHGINVGNNCVIGANSYVHNDIEDNSLAYGTPAKFVRKREAGEKYL